MGKIRTKVLGGAEEEIQKKKDEARREAKKEKKLAKLKGKGGGRIIDMSAEETLAPKIIEEVAEEEAKISKKEKKKPRARGKKIQEKRKLVKKNNLYSISEAVKLVKQTSYSRFVGSVEAHINTKEKGLRGVVKLPFGTGKKIRVAVADEALIEKIQKNQIDFDILVAHPSIMPKLARVARILGPKGLMPNPKNGTISAEPEKAVEKFTSGEVQWRTEAEAPIIHFVFGRVDFEEKKLEENLKALIKAINPAKINSVFVKATMGPSIKVKFDSD